MKIWCKSGSLKKNIYTSVERAYSIQITRKKRELTIRFGASDGLSIPVDVAERIAHAILAAGSESFTASWREAE